MLAPNAQFWLPFLETPIFFNPLSFKNYLMKIHKFGKKQNTKGQIYRCKKLNQDICYTWHCQTNHQTKEEGDMDEAMGR